MRECVSKRFQAMRCVKDNLCVVASVPTRSYAAASTVGELRRSSLPLRLPTALQRRSMFIQTQSTPNPNSMMFLPGGKVMEEGSADFSSAREAMRSPLAKKLFGIDGALRNSASMRSVGAIVKNFG